MKLEILLKYFDVYKCDELFLKPDVEPFYFAGDVRKNASQQIWNAAAINMIVFPIVPPAQRAQLPNRPEIEFDYESEIGKFHFTVGKSPAGFTVAIKKHGAGAAAPAAAAAPPPPANSDAARNASASPPQPAFPVRPQPLSIPREPAAANSFAAEPKPYPNPNFRQTTTAAPTQAPAPVAAVGAPSFDNLKNLENELSAAPVVSDFPAEPQDYPAPAKTNGAARMPAAVNQIARQKMDQMFRRMAAAKSSDLHLSVSMPPMVRKDGRMTVLAEGQEALTSDVMRELLWSIMPEKNREEFERRHDTDFAYEIADLARFRANIFMDRKGMGGVFRIIPTKILTAEQLGLSEAILNLCNLSKGLVVVTGPTGSGKSTTLCAMIDHVNKTREDHIITIEDPIEFVHENQKCLLNQREVHNHTDSFKDALRAALREDPDILLVGEMRDLETISIAIETAETGHLVFGTLHTTTAPSTVDRIIDQFPADRQQQIRVMLSESLKGVIAQTLLPKKGGGRVAAMEILIVTPAISNLIREGKTFQIASSMQTGKQHGMVVLNDALVDLVKSGQVEPRDAYIKAVDKTGLEASLKRLNISI